MLRRGVTCRRGYFLFHKGGTTEYNTEGQLTGGVISGYKTVGQRLKKLGIRLALPCAGVELDEVVLLHLGFHLVGLHRVHVSLLEAILASKPCFSMIQSLSSIQEDL